MDKNKRLAGLGLVIGLLLTSAAVAPANAAAGTYTRGNYQITFFYDLSSGNATSYSKAGRGYERLSLDAPGVNYSATAVGELYLHGLWSDKKLTSLSASYSAAEKKSAQIKLSSGEKYYTRAVWNYSGDKPGMPSGFARRIQ